MTPQRKRLWKTLREREKMLVTSIFSSLNVFYSKREIVILSTFVVCKCFQFRPVQNLVIWYRVKKIPVREVVKNILGNVNADIQQFFLVSKVFYPFIGKLYLICQIQTYLISVVQKFSDLLIHAENKCDSIIGIFLSQRKQEGHDGPGSLTSVIFPTNKILHLCSFGSNL